MTHLLYTYCNKAKGDFLIDHWLFSAKQHVCLDQIDILVIDFGLSADQVGRLREASVLLWPAKLDGRWSNIHYRELAKFLDDSDTAYDQVIYSDCGDIVFQADLAPILTRDKRQLRVVLEPEFDFVLHGLTLGFGDVRPEKLPEVRNTIGGLATANGGFVVGPASKMRQMWGIYQEMCHGTALHGTDQLILNYILRRDGFVPLERKWNYVTFLNDEAFQYDEERFICKDGERIPVVHNAGRYDWARAIESFGYRGGKVRTKLFRNCVLQFYRALRRLSWVAAILRPDQYRVQ